MVTSFHDWNELYFSGSPASEILVISDNYYLASFLMNTLSNNLSRKRPNVDLCFSLANKTPQSLIDLGAKPVNLKDKNCIQNILKKYDLVISMHCKQIFPKELVNNLLCVNIHPGFNPINRGWYPQVFSIKDGTIAGATIHVMDEMVDHGPIIDQKQVDIFPSDTSLDVYNRIIELEKLLILNNINNIVNKTFSAKLITEEGNYNSISDFKSICQLDLNSVDSLRNHINLLRALTHGDFQNAYFIDNGQKYYVRISISKEGI